MTTDNTWADVRQSAIDAIREHVEYQDGSIDWDDVRDSAHEYADSSVPVYNVDRMAVAADPEVWGREIALDLGPGADLMQIVGVYIYEACAEAIHAEIDRMEQEADDA